MPKPLPKPDDNSGRDAQGLGDSQRRLESIFRAAPTGIGLVANRVLIDVNDRVCEMTGYSRAELLGRSARILYLTDEDFEYVGHAKYEQIARQGTGTVETRWRCKDGQVIDVLLSSTPLDMSDLGAGVTFTALDITDRKRAARALSESEARYRAMFEGTPDAVFLADAATGLILDANPAAERLLGRPREAIVGMHQARLHPPESEPAMREAFAGHIRRGHSVEPLECVVRRADGSDVPVEVLAVRVDLGGRPALQGVFRDISQRKETLAHLAALSRRNESLLAAIPDIIMEVDRDKVYTWANAAGYEFFGDDCLGREASYYFEGPQEIYGDVARLFNGDEHVIYVESRQRRCDGQVRLLAWWCRTLKDAAGNVIGALSTARDITDAKAVEDELRYRLTFENTIASISSHLINIEPHELDAAISNALACIGAFTGADRSYVFCFSPDGRTMSNTHEWCADGIDSAQARLRDISTDSLWNAREVLSKGRILHIPRVADLPPEAAADRHEFQAEAIQSLLCVPMTCGDHVIGFVGFDAVAAERTWSEDEISLLRTVGEIFANALERMRAEQRIRQSEARYRLVVESAEQPIFIVNKAGVFEFMNAAGARGLGAPVNEIAGRTLGDLYPPQYADGQMADVAEALKTGRLRVAEYESVVGDQPRWYYARIQPLPDESGRCDRALVILTDITESKLAEKHIRERRDELAHVWRVNTIGEMASGLAHELNQPLCAILNYADATLRILQSEPAGERVVEAIEKIANQADRAGQIIRRIRSLAGKREPHRSVIHINDVVREVIDMVGAESVQEGIDIDLQLGDNLPAALADQIEIEEVALNLVRNAFDAMSDTERRQRRLTVQTSVNAEGAVEVRVSDCGKGLPPDMIPRIFDPFYTTKATGMGIGLSLSRTIIEAHGGRLWAMPGPERGLSVCFTLPIRGHG